MFISGLPEGFEAVEIRAPKENELYFNCGRVIVANRGSDRNPQLIVKAAPGYSVDLDVPSGTATAVMVFEQPKSMRVNFLAFSDRQEKQVHKLIDAARNLGITVSSDF